MVVIDIDDTRDTRPCGWVEALRAMAKAACMGLAITRRCAARQEAIEGNVAIAGFARSYQGSFVAGAPIRSETGVATSPRTPKSLGDL